MKPPSIKFASVECQNLIQFKWMMELFYKVRFYHANNIEELTIETANLGKDDITTEEVDGGLVINDLNADSVTKLTIKE